MSEQNGAETGVLFYINSDGFPISEPVWQRMFAHASITSQSDRVVELKHTSLPPQVPLPRVPLNLPADMAVHEKVAAVQQYMRDLQYNHTGTQFFDIKKYRPVYGLMESAKEMMRESLPIKCLEAVILGLFLTNGIPGLKRFPIGFRTQFGDTVHRHVVLGLCWYGRFGAVGMSRREDLMYKPLEFSSLGHLIVDFIESYNQYWHSVRKVKVGYPVTHDPLSCEPIHWKGTTVSPSKMSREEILEEFDKHMKSVKTWTKSYPVGTYAPKGDPPPPPVKWASLERRGTEIDRSRMSMRSIERDAAKSYSREIKPSDSSSDRPSASLSQRPTTQEASISSQFDMRI